MHLIYIEKYYLQFLMIAKYLEKMGDHAVIIAEWEVFRENGTMKEFRIF